MSKNVEPEQYEHGSTPGSDLPGFEFFCIRIGHCTKLAYNDGLEAAWPTTSSIP